jgi:hypothetical protein
VTSLEKIRRMILCGTERMCRCGTFFRPLPQSRRSWLAFGKRRHGAVVLFTKRLLSGVAQSSKNNALTTFTPVCQSLAGHQAEFLH